MLATFSPSQPVIADEEIIIGEPSRRSSLSLLLVCVYSPVFVLLFFVFFRCFVFPAIRVLLYALCCIHKKAFLIFSPFFVVFLLRFFSLQVTREGKTRQH